MNLHNRKQRWPGSLQNKSWTWNKGPKRHTWPHLMQMSNNISVKTVVSDAIMKVLTDFGATQCSKKWYQQNATRIRLTSWQYPSDWGGEPVHLGILFAGRTMTLPIQQGDSLAKTSFSVATELQDDDVIIGMDITTWSDIKINVERNCMSNGGAHVHPALLYMENSGMGSPIWTKWEATGKPQRNFYSYPSSGASDSSRKLWHKITIHISWRG